MSLSSEDIIRFLKTDLGVKIDNIDQETLLFSSGIIDSFSLISLLMFIETEGGVKVSPADVNLANFDSVARVTKFIGRQLA
jgi:acyl carrier protein